MITKSIYNIEIYTSRIFYGGVIMLRFEKRLTQIFLKAREQALKKRSQDVITTSDLFAELVEDSEIMTFSTVLIVWKPKRVWRKLQERLKKF